MESAATDTPPAWVKDAVFYQIFPDRFAKSESLLKPSNLEPWLAAPTERGYKGGDLRGIMERLDYLEDLGINAIYLNPIFQSASNHRYHTHDYFRVDPLLGGNEALRDLVKAVHDRDIRIILDGVFNHASRGFFQFNDILENGQASPWVDWFHIKGWPVSAYDLNEPANYECWFNLRPLPKLNTDNPEVRSFIMAVAEYWLNEFDIDGWRLDVPTEIKSQGFWEEFRMRVKGINPEAYIVGEIWHEAMEWVNGERFDAVTNYPFAQAAIAFAAGDRVSQALVKGRDYRPFPALDGTALGKELERLADLYGWEFICTQMNLIASHDTPRLSSLARGDKNSLKLAALIQMTYPGAPCIYYGDEIGIRGTDAYESPHRDPDARWAFPWSDRSIWDEDLLSFYRRLIALRRQHRALRDGRFMYLGAERDCTAYAREAAGEVMIVALNAGEAVNRWRFPYTDWQSKMNVARLSPEMQIVLGSGTFRIEVDQDLLLEIPGRSGFVVG